MTTPSQSKSYVIIVGVDYAELGDLALEHACEMAKAHEPSHLHVVHVTTLNPSHSDTRDEAWSRGFKEASTRLHEHAEQVIKTWRDAHALTVPFARLTTHVRTGSPADAIAQLASDVEADLVVVGTHGRPGARRFVLGSVAERTMRLAPCPVLVVRPPDVTVPEIEPPCPRCIETRRATEGKEIWCAQHREHHDKRHTYHYEINVDTHQSGFLIHME